MAVGNRRLIQWPLLSIAPMCVAASGCSRYVNTLDGPSPLAGAYAFRSYRMVGWTEGRRSPDVNELSDQNRSREDAGDAEEVPSVIIREDGSFDLRAYYALSLFTASFTDSVLNLRRTGDKAYLRADIATKRDCLEVTRCEFSPESSFMEFIGRGRVGELLRRMRMRTKRLTEDQFSYELEVLRSRGEGRFILTGTLVPIPRERWPLDLLNERPSEPPPEPGEQRANGS